MPKRRKKTSMTMIHNELSPMEQRNAEICAMHKNGASYHHIAHTWHSYPRVITMLVATTGQIEL